MSSKGRCIAEKLTCLFLLLAFPARGRSEIYNCGGVWTNKPCEGEAPKEVLPEVKPTPDLQGEASEKKRSFLSTLRLKLVSASKAYDVWTDISGIEESCKSEGTTIDQCLTLVQNAEGHIDSRVAEAKLLREQEKTNELLKREAENKSGDRNTTAISVTEDNSLYVIREPRSRHGHAAPPHGHDHDVGTEAPTRQVDDIAGPLRDKWATPQGRTQRPARGRLPQ